MSQPPQENSPPPRDRHLGHLQRWLMHHSLWAICLAPLFTQLVGSAFNIWYNLSHIKPLLTSAQLSTFIRAIGLFNGLVYPVAIALWMSQIWSFRRPLAQLLRGQEISPRQLLRAQQRAINLPWYGSFLAGICWLLCIPVFLIALGTTSEPLDSRLFLHLPVSILVAAFIAVTHGFFAIELVSQWLLYPIFFPTNQPADTPGAFPLSLRGRGLMWAISAGVCPITSLLLLMLADQPVGGPLPWFELTVGALSMVFGLTTAWMVSQQVIEPVQALQKAAKSVSEGDLGVELTVLRADEFGPLIEEFQAMVSELQEKQRLQETFGRHVGQQVAAQILRRDPSLNGVEQEITVLFADIRNFTARCALASPQQIVMMLNLFLTEMVDVVEGHNGMVNKFLGDGFMALFGIGEGQGNHAADAVAAGQRMLARLEPINAQLMALGQPPLAIGIGIHTGRAVVGSIGSSRRLEYTAIGDTVNVASRIEGLTKVLDRPLLMSEATRRSLPASTVTEALAPQRVKGQPQPIAVYCLPAPQGAIAPLSPFPDRS